MAMMPKRVKYRKLQRGKNRGVATRGTELSFGEYGLKALENGMLKNTQIESVRVILARQTHRGGKFWLRVFPDKSVTKKPAEVRMGKRKGELDHWVCRIKRGKVLFELGGLPEEVARHIFRATAYKLPFRSKLITRMHK